MGIKMRKFYTAVLIPFSFLLYNCSDGHKNSVLDTNILVKFDNHIFSGSGNCAVCHSNLITDTGEDVSIDKDWRSTMMANSAKDPLWQAKVHSEILRNPTIGETIEQKCSKCHMPMANVEANHEQIQIKIFGTNGFLDPNNSYYHLMAMEGVSCTVCHQIEDGTYLGTKTSFTGGFKIDLNTQKPDRKIYGQYNDPFQRPMIMNVGYTPVYGAHMEKSEFCATCHTLYTNPYDSNGNPVTDINGNKINFPEQTPYLEWKNSIYGDEQGNDDKSCQSCHMPKAKGKVKISNRPQSMIQARNNFAKHYFVGGNVFILNILKKNIATLNLTAQEELFNQTIKRTQDILKSSAQIQIGNIVNNNNILEIPVTVLNKSGHKLPSGYPSRRVWIHFLVKDANGLVVFESGKVEQTGKIIGNNADENATQYEPHYDVIDSPDKVQIYETIMLDYNNNITYTLMKAKQYIKDNRLLPQGFDKTTVSSDIAVKGNANIDNNFTGGQDIVLYKVNISGYSAPFTITAELKYQSVAYRFFKDLIIDNSNSQYISLFEKLYLQENNTGYVISSSSRTF